MKKYTYGIGASWVLELRGYAGVRRLVQFTVKDCRLKRGVEYYDVEQREQGKEVQQIEDMSASRLHYLINFHCIEKLSSGRAADYPLTPAEVTEYYKTLTADKKRRKRTRKRSKRNAARRSRRRKRRRKGTNCARP